MQWFKGADKHAGILCFLACTTRAPSELVVVAIEHNFFGLESLVCVCVGSRHCIALVGGQTLMYRTQQRREERGRGEREVQVQERREC